MGNCDTAALQRTLAFGQKYRINGTPALFFENGERVPGALSGADLAKRLDEARKPKS
jgi:thiol:disulfide interchange protein DsbC